MKSYPTPKHLFLPEEGKSTITSGKDGEFGAVRSVANEVLVGKTELSYTYTQPVREGPPCNLYHGTLEARPIDATTSKLVYTLFFEKMQARRRQRNCDGIQQQRETVCPNSGDRLEGDECDGQSGRCGHLSRADGWRSILMHSGHL